PALRQPLQNGQHERGGFPCTGLRRPDEVTPFEGERDGFLLNGGGLLVAFFGYGAHQFGHEPECGKRHDTRTPSHTRTPPPASVPAMAESLRRIEPGE